MTRDADKNEEQARPRKQEPKPDAQGVGPGAYRNVYDEQDHTHGTPGKPELADPEHSGPRHDVALGEQTHEKK